MFSPIFTINNQILKNIGTLEAAKAVIDEAPLIPAYEKQFQQEAVIRTVHYGTRIEGNDLTYQDVAKLVEGRQVTAADRDIQEVINYRNVIKYLEEIGLPLMPVYPCLRKNIKKELILKPTFFIAKALLKNS